MSIPLSKIISHFTIYCNALPPTLGIDGVGIQEASYVLRPIVRCTLLIREYSNTSVFNIAMLARL